MKYDLVVISGTSPDSRPCVALTFLDAVYLFNCPDQTQRIFRENKIRFAKLDTIFMTSLHSHSLGGFHGLLITVMDNKQKNVQICAPTGIESVLESYRNLHTNENIKPNVVESVSDKNIQAKTIPLHLTNAYDVQLCEVPGKFLIQKAKEFQIPPGPVYRKLQDGETITLDDGRVIQPEMVVGPPTPGEHILFVDCRCEEDIDMLPDCKNYDFVIHFTNLDILRTEKYLSKFSPDQRALIFTETGHITFPSVANLYQNILEISDLFKPLVHYETDKSLNLGKNFVIAEQGLEFAFCPVEKKKFNFPKYDVKLQKVPKIELPKIQSFGITFTGTGSTYPSKYRNVVGILLHTTDGYIVFDAGEGFVGQIMRKFGIENCKEILKKLIAIFISHNHGDHVFGCYELLQTRSLVTDEDVPIFCPDQLRDHLLNLQKVSRFGNLHFHLLSREELAFSTGSTTLEFIPVIHCKGSHAVVANISGGYRVVYSGDKSFSEEFAKKVGKCDLLIHESTFSDDLVDEATAKRHSTMGQAIETGKLCNAKYIVLTHFSQRYPKLPVFEGSGHIAFAFDYLSFVFEDIQKLCEVCPKIFQMISDLEAAEEEAKN